jgi:ketosteroid isomerase-like protein
MSEENVEAIRRATDAYNRGDIDAVLEELDPKIEWHPLLQVLLGGEATVYRGHEGVRELYRDFDEAFTELQAEQSEFRDLGEQVVAMGHFRGRGRESGASTETAIVWLVEFRHDKAVRIREYLDPAAALEAAGLRSRRCRRRMGG